MKLEPYGPIGDLTVRLALASDIDGLRDVELASQPSPWSEVVFERELDVPQSSFWVVEEAGTIQGFLVFWVVYDEVHILNIAVHPRARRRGVANGLLSQLIQRSQELAMTSISLEVRVSNVAAQNLYGGFGFRQIGRRKAYYADNQEDALVLAAVVEEISHI